MRLILLLLALAALPAQAETVTLGDRFYEISLPADPDGAPMILALHGGGGSPDQLATASGLGEMAAKAGYAVIFPAGSGRRGDRLLTWNAGYCCGYALRRDVDDLGFLSEVIADAAARYGLDAGRVYLTGMSNGSMMVESYAARNPDRIKAVAGVSGSMDTGAFHPASPIPVLIIHGTADRMVPYDGGEGDRSITRTDYASVASVVQAFLLPWGDGVTQTSTTIDRKEDGTSVTVTDYSHAGAVVLRLMTVTDGANHWPGDRKARLTEGKTAEIDANTEILRFFALYP